MIYFVKFVLEIFSKMYFMNFEKCILEKKFKI